MQNHRCRQNKNMCKPAVPTVHKHKDAWNHTARMLIETPFKVDSSGLSVDVENYCSDPMNPCTIKTPACWLGTGVFISCGNKSYMHSDMRRELNSAKKHFRIQCCSLHACLPILNAPMSAPMPPKHENKQTINIDVNTIFK